MAQYKATPRAINRSLAARETAIAPLIAETGGLNGMFVDTTALREQVVDDAIMSAFGSAGQRCSALRIIFVPEDTADELIESLKKTINQQRELFAAQREDERRGIRLAHVRHGNRRLEDPLEHLQRSARGKRGAVGTP